MKTENTSDVGRHAFEVAGLGAAPFTFVGASENVITYPDGTQQAAGTCDYCGTGIRFECHVVSSDRKNFVVGCNCVAKVGELGVLKAYKSSPEYRAHQRKLAHEKSLKVTAELVSLIESRSAEFSALPHPYGYVDRQTGRALTKLDSVNWTFQHSGAAGRASLLRWLKKS